MKDEDFKADIIKMLQWAIKNMLEIREKLENSRKEMILSNWKIQ
jgi:hypothetical protein